MVNIIDNFFEELEDGSVRYNPSLKNIEVFKTLIVNSRKDGSKRVNADKAKRISEEKLSYVYLMSCPHSYYFFAYSDDNTRSERILKSLGVKDWKPDGDTDRAISYLREELESMVNFDILTTGINAAIKTKNYFRDIDYSKTNNGKLVYDPNTVFKMLKELGQTLDGLEELNRRYRKEKEARKKKLRNQRKVSKFEFPPDQR